MKRLTRNPETFDMLELYSAIARQEGYRIGKPADDEAFLKRISTSMKAALGKPHLIHGKRVEAMFAHVIGALGGCQMIKQEDGGATFVTYDNIAIPDYRVITNDERLLLVEVKNFHQRKPKQRFTLKKSYLASLKRYAMYNRAELKIAIYFSCMKKWALLPPEAFFEKGDQVWIDFAHAIARNEMSSFGDRIVATLPPLTLELLANIDQGGAIVGGDGNAVVTFGAVRISCAGDEIINPTEQQIAFYLMRYGDWAVETSAKVVDGRLVSLSFTCAPEVNEDPNDQSLEAIGNLSSMISNAFRELTVDDSRGVVALDAKCDPQFFRLEIPLDYRGNTLPLWQLAIQPNFEFKGLQP